jgi:uncharacterized protein (DUF1015 family)
VDGHVQADAIRNGFAVLDTLYIADGHHRAAAAAQVGARRRQRQGAAGEADEAGYVLIVAFPADQLVVIDYNRVVSDTNGLSSEELLVRAAEGFDVKPAEAGPCRPRMPGEFAMYLEGRWYRLTIRDGVRPTDLVAGLDVSLLQDRLLAPVLGLVDPRSDRRIAYVGGARGLGELERRADDKAGVAFALYPCSLNELFAVADAGFLMPPKSTWFEPKPRSGLFIHKIEG